MFDPDVLLVIFENRGECGLVFRVGYLVAVIRLGDLRHCAARRAIGHGGSALLDLCENERFLFVVEQALRLNIAAERMNQTARCIVHGDREALAITEVPAALPRHVLRLSGKGLPLTCASPASPDA